MSDNSSDVTMSNLDKPLDELMSSEKKKPSGGGGGGGGRGGRGGGRGGRGGGNRGRGRANSSRDSRGKGRNARQGIKEKPNFEANYIGTGGPAKSVEGWIVLVTGVHEEAQESDVMDHFADYGKVETLHLNLERRTGFCKGYALIEFKDKRHAEKAISQGSGSSLLGEELSVDWAFVQPQRQGGRGRRR